MLDVAQGLTEPFDLADVYVSGLAYIEELPSGDYRIVYYVEKRHERVVNLSVIFPRMAMPAGWALAVEAIGCHMGHACPLKKPAH